MSDNTTGGYVGDMIMTWNFVGSDGWNELTPKQITRGFRVVSIDSFVELSFRTSQDNVITEQLTPSEAIALAELLKKKAEEVK